MFETTNQLVSADSEMGLFPHMSSVQNPSIIPFNPGCFFFWIPRSWIIIPNKNIKQQG